jgi:hypothetical protein
VMPARTASGMALRGVIRPSGASGREAGPPSLSHPASGLSGGLPGPPGAAPREPSPTPGAGELTDLGPLARPSFWGPTRPVEASAGRGPNGVRVCAPVHDAVLIEAPADEIDGATAETQAVLAAASGIALGGPTLRSDAQIVRFRDRLLDDDSGAFWGRLMGFLAGPLVDRARVSGPKVRSGVGLGPVGSG